MDERVVSALGELRLRLQGELEGLGESRLELERELGALVKEIESKQRVLELVEATERQLAGQGRRQQDLEGGGAGASTQVWVSDAEKLACICMAHLGLLYLFDSLCQRLPASGPMPRLNRHLRPSSRGPSP
jgi:hypothetical protein